MATDKAEAESGEWHWTQWTESSTERGAGAIAASNRRDESAARTSHGSANPTRSAPECNPHGDERSTRIDHSKSRETITHPVTPHDTVPHPILPPHVPDDLPEALVPRAAVLALHPDLEHLDLAD